MRKSWTLFAFGIFLQLYVGFRLVFTFPDAYPHFRWLFALVEHVSGK